ncbi:MAG: N-acetyl sugar amidotransferase [Bacilli bacterium]|nr:N-acetyl sugar amidotransferase [Bacilli bacterium]
MKYCTKCVMPSTRPGITFNEEGVCAACQSYERRKSIDWDERYKELEKLCDKYRGINGNGYDCAIAVSGGKDSHYQVYLMKEVMHMNPILFSVEDNFKMTEAGKHNIKNISEAFGCNIISLKPDIKTQKKLMRYTFEKYGKPTWFIDRLIYTYPMHMAAMFNIPLLVYGENVSYEYGGADYVETYSAKDQLKNGVASDIDLDELIANTGVTKEALNMTLAPSKEEMEKLDPMYVSYFIPWNSFSNYHLAKKYGFRDLTHEWDRTHHVENFDQIDSPAYLVHSWLKYPKFGHAAATDYTARMIRYGMLTREEAIELVKERDGNLDPRSVREFCEFVGYTESEFWNIMDKFYNKDLFEKNSFGEWVLKKPIWNSVSKN